MGAPYDLQVSRESQYLSWKIESANSRFLLWTGNMPMKEFILYTQAIERQRRLGQATDRRGAGKRTEKPASLGLGAVEGELTGGALNAQRASPRLVRVLVETHGVRDVVREAMERLRAWKGKE